MGLSTNTAVLDVAPGTEEIVAAVTNKKIIVHSFIVSADTAESVGTWKSATTSIGGDMRFADEATVVAPHNPLGWFATVPGAALQFTAATGTITGNVQYSISA
jgi:hypothetical protein